MQGFFYGIPMLNQLLGYKNFLFGNRLDLAQDGQVTAMIGQHDPEFVDYFIRNKLGVNTNLRNGETVMTYGIKAAQIALDNRIAAYQFFNTETAPLQEAVAMIETSQRSMQSVDPLKQAACVLFSSPDFLDRLQIPVENRPACGFGQEMLNTYYQQYATLAKGQSQATTSLDILNLLTDQVNGDFTAAAPNISGETPVALRSTLQDGIDAFNKPDSIKNTTHRLIETVNYHAASLNFVLTAKDFVLLQSNPMMQHAFPWLTAYKPEQGEFLDLFDPGWRERTAQAKKDFAPQVPKTTIPERLDFLKPFSARNTQHNASASDKPSTSTTESDPELVRDRWEEILAAQKHDLQQAADNYSQEKDEQREKKLKEDIEQKARNAQQLFLDSLHFRNAATKTPYRERDRGWDMER